MFFIRLSDGGSIGDSGGNRGGYEFRETGVIVSGPSQVVELHPFLNSVDLCSRRLCLKILKSTL